MVLGCYAVIYVVSAGPTAVGRFPGASGRVPEPEVSLIVRGMTKRQGSPVALDDFGIDGDRTMSVKQQGTTHALIYVDRLYRPSMLNLRMVCSCFTNTRWIEEVQRLRCIKQIEP